MSRAESLNGVNISPSTQAARACERGPTEQYVTQFKLSHRNSPQSKTGPYLNNLNQRDRPCVRPHGRRPRNPIEAAQEDLIQQSILQQLSLIHHGVLKGCPGASDELLLLLLQRAAGLLLHLLLRLQHAPHQSLTDRPQTRSRQLVDVSEEDGHRVPAERGQGRWGVGDGGPDLRGRRNAAVTLARID